MSAADDGSSLAREALRQRMLLAWLTSQTQPRPFGWLQGDAGQVARGLLAYRGNAQATARRALAAACPTVAALLTEPRFGAVAWRLWQQSPPLRGDLACWGDGLADMLAADAALAAEPWLADVARLDWALHVAEAAHDSDGPPQGLAGLADTDPQRHRLLLRPGIGLLHSRWPVIALRAAVREGGVDAEALARALDATGGDLLVWRDGWRATAEAISPGDARFMRSQCDGSPLADGLDAAAAAEAGWSFEAWLLKALRKRWIASLLPLPTFG